jgi:hypothetical protein
MQFAKVVRRLKVNPKLVQAINNIKNNPLPFEFTPEHVAMFEITNAMMAGRLLLPVSDRANSTKSGR